MKTAYEADLSLKQSKVGIIKNEIIFNFYGNK